MCLCVFALCCLVCHLVRFVCLLCVCALPMLCGCVQSRRRLCQVCVFWLTYALPACTTTTNDSHHHHHHFLTRCSRRVCRGGRRSAGEVQVGPQLPDAEPRRAGLVHAVRVRRRNPAGSRPVARPMRSGGGDPAQALAGVDGRPERAR